MQIEDPRDRRIGELEGLLGAALARIAALEAEVAELKRQLSRNSTNSSQPPSSDLPGIQRPANKASGKKRGGQPGHKGHQRQLLPAEDVTTFVPLVPTQCARCGAGLAGEDPEPYRHQVIDVPPIKPSVTEYQCHALDCGNCGATTRAQLPPGVPLSAFGPRLAAMLAVCTAKYRLSKRAVQEMLSDFLGVELSVGSVSNVERQVSAALATSVAEAHAYVRAAQVVHADETSWRENKKKAWLWVAATPLVSVFLIATSRCSKVAKELLGEAFAGTLVTDRWAGYSWVPTLLRQLCWAHLRRDFQSWVDGGGVGAQYGQSLLAHTKRMFKWWHKVRDGTLPREAFQTKMRALKSSAGALLTDASTCQDRRVCGMAKAMLKLEPALWRFVDTLDVEPTNNFGERTIRHAVLWRKGCFGTDSVDGSRFVERMLTTVATLRQQRRNVLEFITLACEAALKGHETPSMLPQVDHVMQIAA